MSPAFQDLLAAQLPPLTRLVRFKIANAHDADDLLQEICLTAYLKFSTLKDPANFKPWLFRIAQNKCTDYYRRHAKTPEQLTDDLPAPSLRGRIPRIPVRDTLAQLSLADRRLIALAYFDQLPQKEIASALGIPVGTVKSRLHSARQHFRDAYPYPPKTKGDATMQNPMPLHMPDYTITFTDQPPFPVRWEEIMGWFIVPRDGETMFWAMYDFPEKTRSESTHMQVLGPAEVHGLLGVEIRADEYDPSPANALDTNPVIRHFVAQLTDTHCRILSETHRENGVKKTYTFLDGDAFLPNWGFGPDNCGNEINLVQKNRILRTGSTILCTPKRDLLDVVGRAQVTISGKTYDTVCVMDVECYDDGVATEQYLDAAGRTILWRRFNRDDWKLHRYGTPWTQRLPENERITINGDTYVHWYDCITSYIL